MKFNAEGYLDPGFHDMTLDLIEEHLVKAFPTSNTRPVIIDGYKRHRVELQATKIGFEQFINGSFVSTKNDPGDIDLVCFADSDAIDQLIPQEQASLRALFAGPNTRATHCCDAYFTPTVPETDSRFHKIRKSRKYWMGEFGYDRLDRPKGIVRSQVGPDDEGT